MSEADRPDAETNRDKILDAAERLFVDQGYDATSLRQIAQRAGVAKSLISHHFQSKLELWEEVKVRRMRDFAQRQQEVFDHGVVSVPRFTDAIVEYFQLLQQDPALVQLLLRRKLEDSPEDDRFDQALVQQFVQRLEQMQQEGLLRAGIQPCFILALVLAAAHHWFEARHILLKWPQITACQGSDSEYVDAFVDILLHGVLPREEQL